MNLQACFDALDSFNAQDPRLELGEPQELLYARRMSAWLDRLAPHASPELRLAARAQHIGRWLIPRSEFGEGPVQYKKWRNALTQLHTETAVRLLSEQGVESEILQRMVSLMRKERLKLDADSQVLEDVVCLVFLENYFADFSAKHDADKVVDIVRKTWKKMSARGQEEALRLPLAPAALELVGRALA